MIFPYQIEIERSRLPIVTYLLLSLNVIVFIIFKSISLPQQEMSVKMLGFFADNFSFDRAVISTFLHAGYLHLLGNMFFFWIYGRYVEDYIGYILFLILYFTSSIVAAVIQMISVPHFLDDIPCIGASGAISGILGAFFIIFNTSRVRCFFFSFFLRVGRPITMPANIVLGSWFILQLIYALTSDISWFANVAFWAHIGGFFYGCLFGGVFLAVESLLKRFEPKDKTAFGIDSEILIKSQKTLEYTEDISELEKIYYLSPGNSIFSSNPTLLIKLARYFVKIGKWSNALNILKGLISRENDDNKNDIILYEIGDIYLNLFNDKEIAQKILDILIKSYPESKLAESAKFIIKQISSHV